MPGSETTSTRTPPKSRASSPIRASTPCPKTMRVRGAWSKDASGATKRFWGWGCSEKSRDLDGAALVKELEHVALVRLVPRDFHGGDGPNVQALDQRRVE